MLKPIRQFVFMCDKAGCPAFQVTTSTDINPKLPPGWKYLKITQPFEHDRFEHRCEAHHSE